MEKEQFKYDIAGTGELEKFGLNAIRFTNSQVENNLDEVMNKIRTILYPKTPKGYLALISFFYDNFRGS